MHRYREGISNLSVSFETNIEFYTEVNFALMKWSQATVVVPHHAALWSMVTGIGALLRSSCAFVSIHASLCCS